MAVTDPYSLEDAERDIAALRGLVDRMSEVLTKLDSTDPPTIPAAGIIHHSTAGHHKYASADGGYYSTGRGTIAITANQVISSFGSNTIIGANSVPMSWPVAAGKYRVQGMINYTQGGTGSANSLGFQGPSISSHRVASWYKTATEFALTAWPQGAVNSREFSGATLGTQASGNYGAGIVVEWWFYGVINFTAAGTFSIVAAEGTNLATFTIGADSSAELLPCT